MKKSMKSKLAIGAVALCLSGSVWLCPAGHAYQVNDINMMWGKPAAIVKTAAGTEMRYYRVEFGDAAFYRVFEVMPDGKAVDKGMDVTIWKDHQ